ncbi:hypothetical protein [Maribacter flavus]|uniref:Pectate lyase n=1 Tax=Maribacter flavus TaxID=1658664 RepID=A0A5B2TT74_9FLAO|nr:hypothetical protein [Maribacter flavus]KAA2217459.1 hypothetical protein F0361_16090 [Maribacter flavus]
MYPIKTPLKMPLAFLALISFLSCSKDADLLSDYVIAKDNDLQSIALLVDDSFFMAPGQNEIVMDVLNNDSFGSNTQVRIVETSTPNNGEVIINADNTLTYTPQVQVPATQEEATPEETTTPPVQEPVQEDTFTYTAEVTTPDNEVSREEATVTISASDMGELKAFPGAEGYGKNTTGGRGGMVYHVTNLNNDGQGSLRYGMESIKGPRTVVFDVSGYININEPLKIRDGFGNITIAGQTAPGDGVAIRGASIWILDSNVIIRHIKIRPGKDAWNPHSIGGDGGYEPDDGLRIVAFTGSSIENVIIDHVTVTWGHDSIIDIEAPNTDFGTYAKNITIQNCLLGENVDKNYGMLVQRAYDISFYRNILTFTLDRNIAIQSAEGKGVEMVNNLIYGTDRAAWQIKGTVNDFIGNKFISGPFERHWETFRFEDGPHVYDLNRHKTYMLDNTDNGENADGSVQSTYRNFITNSPNHYTELPIISQAEIEESLINNSGDNLHYDSSDIRMLNNIKNRTGKLIRDENEIGGYPSLQTVVRSANYDQDNDGMSDEWERQIYGDLSKTANGDENGNGYTNLEEFLHSLTL